ncbi:MAG: hypothetical protein AB7O62_11285 [Pirellulales bacterium]
MAAKLSLAERIDTEFAAAAAKIEAQKNERVQHYHERQQRLEELDGKLESLKGVWRPRLDALAQRFSDKVKVTPTVTSESRMATFEFQSELARINLRFCVMADEDVRNVIFQYDLDIIPIHMAFEKHDELRLPLTNIDQQALADWIDDRIVTFVKTYLAIQENNYYLQDHLVEDPIAKIRFPKFAAGAKLDWQGKTIYFIGQETRQQFEQQQAGTKK